MLTSELKNAALDWAVAKCEGIATRHKGNFIYYAVDGGSIYGPSKKWAQGGPIIQKSLLGVSPDSQYGWRCNSYMDETGYYGSTPLIAAMRCYVASNLGDEVEIPLELQGENHAYL
jgi:hypothetical protein